MPYGELYVYSCTLNRSITEVLSGRYTTCVDNYVDNG